MTTMQTTYPTQITVKGQTTTTDRRRRYAVVTVRETPVTTDAGTYVAFARVDGRTDDAFKAKKLAAASMLRRGIGCEVVVVDRATVDLAKSPGRGPAGQPRQFGRMGAEKLAQVTQALRVFGRDPEALALAVAAA
jgi:hypothetical protein